MNKYKYSIFFKIKVFNTVIIYLFLIILSSIKFFNEFSIWYMLLGILSAFGLLLWINFFVFRPSLYLDEEGYDFIPRRGFSKFGKKVYWKNIVKVRRYPFFPGFIYFYKKYEIMRQNGEKWKIGICGKLILPDYQGKQKLLQEIIHYCQHAEIDPRLVDNKDKITDSYNKD